MKKGVKILLTIAIVLLFGVVMALTVPDKKAHKQAMMKAVTEYVDEEVDGFFGQNALTTLGKSVVVKTVGLALNLKLREKNYIVFNTTYVRVKGKNHTLSVGLLGHVITFDKDMIREKLEEALNAKGEAD